MKWFSISEAALLLFLLAANPVLSITAQTKPRAPKITPNTWQRFLSLADSILRVNETIPILPDPHFLSFKLDSVQPVNLHKCRHWVTPNPTCPDKGSIQFECAFTSRMFEAQLFQHRPIEWGKFRLSVEEKEKLRYRQLQGHLEGAMTECCESTWQKEPVVFPYLLKVHIDRVGRCSMTHHSDLRMPPEAKTSEEVRKLLKDLLNSYFRIYLAEYFYFPPC